MHLEFWWVCIFRYRDAYFNVVCRRAFLELTFCLNNTKKSEKTRAIVVWLFPVYITMRNEVIIILLSSWCIVLDFFVEIFKRNQTFTSTNYSFGLRWLKYGWATQNKLLYNKGLTMLLKQKVCCLLKMFTRKFKTIIFTTL